MAGNDKAQPEPTPEPKPLTGYVVLERVETANGRVAWCAVGEEQARSREEASRKWADAGGENPKPGQYKGVPVSSWKETVTVESEMVQKTNVTVTDDLAIQEPVELVPAD